MDTAEIQAVLDFEIPENLYVPSPPLWIESKGFKGPLDLLWYLIREQDINILDIPVALIAAQYVQYIRLMTEQRFEIAPDYLVMAVRLIQIKSQMLLPKKIEEESTEEDPRALLVKQLIDYEDIQKTAQFIDQLTRWERDVWPIQISLGSEIVPPPAPDIELHQLFEQYQHLQKKQSFKKEHEVSRPVITLSERMQWIYQELEVGVPYPFLKLFNQESVRLEMLISFQATLELAKSKQIEVHQAAWQDELMLERL